MVCQNIPCPLVHQGISWLPPQGGLNRLSRALARPHLWKPMEHNIPLITTLAAGFGIALVLGFLAERIKSQ